MTKKTKKIGIITYHAADNYGSVLQAYALNRFLIDNFSEDCKVINYQSKQQRKMYALYFENKSIKDVLKNIYIFFALKLRKQDRIQKFSSFRKEHIVLYPEIATSNIEKLNLNGYDAVVCGSDQIWNVRVKDYNSVYMLKDIDVPCKLSYAASMGGVDLQLSKEEAQQIYESLKDYRGISVRENVAKKMLSDCMLNDVNVNIDPTFLIQAEQWKQIMSPKIVDGKYIFFYSVDYNEESVKIAEWYGNKLNLPVIYMNTSWRSYFIKEGRLRHSEKCGVEDFLSLIYYAEAVLSGSFHGTAFSLIFNKPFYRIQRNRNKEAIIDDRVGSLFETLGIQDREINTENYQSKVNELFDMQYRIVNKEIDRARNTAKKYFASILSEEVRDEN